MVLKKTYKHNNFKNKIKKQNNKKSKRRKSILYKGAGDKPAACRKYRENKSMSTYVGPAYPPKMAIETTDQENGDTFFFDETTNTYIIYNDKTPKETYYKTVLDSLLAYDTDPSSFLILKLGSNDSDEAIKQGSLGIRGHLYWETRPLPTGKKTSKLIDMRLSPLLLKQFKKFSKEKGCKLLAISPATQYENYQYPFINNEDDTIFSVIADECIKETKYIQSYFPIGVNSDIDSNNNKLLKYLSTRQGPLLIFNAMGSWCFSSIKYILDMRNNDEFADNTSYAFLTDSTDDTSCEIGIPIYPEPDTSCS